MLVLLHKYLNTPQSNINQNMCLLNPLTSGRTRFNAASSTAGNFTPLQMAPQYFL